MDNASLPFTFAAQIRAELIEKAAKSVLEYQVNHGPAPTAIRAQKPLDDRCTEIADLVVPAYRNGSYSCTGHWAKRWQAAWDGARVALEIARNT